jgi:hypothetical protein
MYCTVALRRYHLQYAPRVSGQIEDRTYACYVECKNLYCMAYIMLLW